MTTNRFRLDSTLVHTESVAAWSTHMGVQVGDPARVRRQLGRGDLASEFARTAARRPAAPALRLGGRWVSRGELDHSAALAASALQRLEVGAGSVVLLIAEADLQTVIAYLGVLRTGGAVVLAHPSLTTAELDHMAEEAGARWLAGSGIGLTRAAAAQTGRLREVVGLAEEDRSVASVVLADLVGDPVSARELDPTEPAVIAFTSGTSGRPKCTPLSHRNLLASMRGVMWAWRWEEADHLLHSLPISHQHGLGSIHATLLAGSKATIMPRFDAGALLDAVVKDGVTVVFGVPAVHRRLLDEAGDGVSALGRLRFYTSGSAPLPVTLAEKMGEITGQLPLERYGSTEAGLDASNPLLGPRIPGTVGLALPGVEVIVVDGSGEPAAPGEVGEVLVRGPHVFSGYRGHGSDGVFLHDWFRTGDMGVFAERSGHLGIVGRAKELIISGGMNVYPREVEEALSAAPGVGEVAVVGVPSERWGEEVVAFVAPATASVDAITRLAGQVLAPYKRPKRILALESIPRSDLGKVATPELVRMAQEDWTSPPGVI